MPIEGERREREADEAISRGPSRCGAASTPRTPAALPLAAEGKLLNDGEMLSCIAPGSGRES